MAVVRKRLFFRLLRWIARLAVLALLALGLVYLLPQHDPDGYLPHPPRAEQPLVLDASDRILILSPHPDDDVLACAGIVQKAVSRGLPVHVAFLTNGDGNEWSFVTYSHQVPMTPAAVLKMGDVRHQEAVAGEAVLGLGQEHLTFLGYPDVSTIDIWKKHWGASPPLRSLLTRVREVPYSYCLQPGAPYKGESIVENLQKVITEFRPTRIFVSHPADRNPDHRALYLFTRVALWHLPQVKVDLCPFLVHTPQWPHPEGLHEDQQLDPPAPFRAIIDWRREALGKSEETHKASAIGAHQTQMSYSADYLLSFVRKSELFGDFVPFDLRADEALVADELASIAGRQWRYARIKDGRLEVSLVYSRPIARNTRATFHFFGDRADRPFGDMPKLSVAVDPFGLTVYDQAVKRTPHDVKAWRVARRTTVSVPLAALGDPQRVLVSAESVLGEVALDYGWWMTFEVRP